MCVDLTVFQTLFRVWDVLLLDGLDVLFRIALAVLKSHEAELLRCESIPAVYVTLESLPTRMWQPDKLLQVRFPPTHTRTYVLIVDCVLPPCFFPARTRAPPNDRPRRYCKET